MTAQELRSALEKRRDDLAKKWANKSFNVNVDDEEWQLEFETFQAGADSLIPLVIRLAEALDSIAATQLSDEEVESLSKQCKLDTYVARAALAELEQFVSGDK